MQALVTFALAWSTPTYVSRRAATAAALLALPTLPQRASALFGIGDNGPQGEFRELANTRSRLRELARQLESKELKGERDDDAVVVLQTLTIQFGGTTKLLAKTTDALPLLDTTELTRARELASRVAQELDNVRQGCRERSATAQLDGARAAGDTLDQYLAVAATKYTLPQEYVAPSYSKDPAEFMAQYYGIFSCEGQGLERVKGSNTCKDSGANKNPFPTQKLLDFDFLTGEKLAK